MQTPEELKRKIETAGDLQSVVKTMKALAAVSIHQYEKAVQSLREYNRTVEMGIQVLLRQETDAAGNLKDLESGSLAAIVFGSDQGMCGSLNDEIVRYAMDFFHKRQVAGDARALIAVGHRTAARLEDAGQNVEEIFSVPGSASGIIPRVQEFLMVLENWHSQRGIGRVELFYCRHLSGASYEPYRLKMLPIDREWLHRVRAREWPGRALPIFTMPREQLFSRLVRQFLFVSLYQAFAESLASENASRLASMQGAEKNLEERLAELNSHFHRRRQMAITEELLDIVSGYEALNPHE